MTMKRSTRINDDLATIYNTAAKEYECKDDLTFDDGSVDYIKMIMSKCLSAADRRLLILYAEIGSVRRLADMLGVGRMSLMRRISKIRKEIKRYL